MLFMLWLIVRLLTRPLVFLVFSDADDGTKDLEILVLRHQLRVLPIATTSRMATGTSLRLPSAGR